MKLHWSPRSPFVRKVLIAAHETDLIARIRCVRTVVAMNKPNADLMNDNPLSKIPTLVLDDGTTIYDSLVICEYLDRLNDRQRLFPEKGPARLTALRRHALGNGFMDLLILWRNERERPREQQSSSHLEAYATKTRATLAALDREAPDLEREAFGIGHIAIGCALSYMDFRYAAENWRGGREALAAWHLGFAGRGSVVATEFVDG